MNRKLEIEARLERSLRGQVRAPRLDGRFDAAVWSRIAAEEKIHAAVPAARRLPGWLVVGNIVGILVTVAVVIVYGVSALNGLDLQLEFSSDITGVSPGQQQVLIQVIAWSIAGAALTYGLMFTRLGRRLRAEFS
jgi:hypothetical protein